MRQRLALAAVLASVAALAAGCGHLEPEPLATPTAPPSRPPPPPVSEFAWSSAPGANGIHGEIAYTDRVGRRWGCSGQSVALMPRTPSTDVRMQVLYGSPERALEPVANVRAHGDAVRGPDPGPYVRTTVCDGRNHFAFDGLPDGGFFLIARVHIEGAHRDGAPSETPDGLALMQRIEVRGGVIRQLALPLRNRP